MWRMSQPELTTREVVEACSAGASGLSEHLRSAIQSMESNATQLRAAIEGCECWKLSAEDFPLVVATAEEVQCAYNSRLVKGMGRPIYDKILAAALRHQCPYCESGTVSTIDHFLAKSAFGALALEPWNLIPACKDCNHSLGAGSAEDANSEFIHPFVWEDDEAWLRAVIVHCDEPVAEFEVAKPTAWSDETFSRVCSHFSRLKLKKRYTEISAAAILETTCSVQHLRCLNEPGEVRNHLAEQADAQLCARGPNHWRTALLRALADDEWYWQTWVWGGVCCGGTSAGSLAPDR